MCRWVQFAVLEIDMKKCPLVFVIEIKNEKNGHNGEAFLDMFFLFFGNRVDILIGYYDSSFLTWSVFFR